MAMTPEAKVKARIKTFLKDNGIYHFSPIGSAFGTHGVSDIICCVNGKFLAIEVKAPGKLKNLTANQEKHMLAVRASGGVAIVTDTLALVVDTVRAMT